MRICVFGAGAIGGHMAVRFAGAGDEVCLVARGAHLAALQRSGLTLQVGAEETTLHLPASADAAAFGVQDVVVVAIKAHGLDGIAAHLVPLLGPDTRVVFAINGLPWWYLDELRGADARESPIRRAVATRRVLHCVVNSSNTIVAPGIIHHDMPSPNNFTFGAAHDDAGATCRALADSISRGGAAGAVSDDIRRDIWRKLQGNAMTHPTACLTGADALTLVSDEAVRGVMAAIAREVAAVAAAWDRPIGFDPAKLTPARYSAHKSSALQDLEAGRPIEIDEVAGAVQEAGRRKSVPTPVIDQCLALVRLKARLLGLYA